MEKEPLTAKPLNSDYQSEWFKEWDDYGLKQVYGTIRWNSHGQETL